MSKIPYARRNDYFRLFEEFLGETKRDIFSGDLVYYDKTEQVWLPVANKIKYLRSEFQAYQEEYMYKVGLRFALSRIEDHLAALEHTSPPKLPIKIPSWDGNDRLEELACRLVLTSRMADFGIDNATVYNYLKWWHSRMWSRVYDTGNQNQIFILTGPQEIGKDFWISQNIGGLGQYTVNFSIGRDEVDNKSQLHQGLVMNISEFDRTAKTDIALLKEIITAASTNLRFKYDRRHQYRLSRCSFIASCNVPEILVDYTGNRRFIIFELAGIKRDYEFSAKDKLQVLAQGMALYKSGFRLRDDETTAMTKYIAAQTPTDPTEEVLEIFDLFCTRKFSDLSTMEQDKFRDIGIKKGFYAFLPNEDLLETFQRISRYTDFKPRRVKNILKNKGRHNSISIAGSTKRGYYFNIVGEAEKVDLEKELNFNF